VPTAFLLDADVPPALADALRQFGYDALAASGDPALGSLSDTDLLAEATRQDRVVVTFNVADFVALTRELARTDRAHAGVILIHSRTFRRSDVGGIARHVDALVRSGRDLRNAVVYLSRREAGS
jgi:predicted nuclease of predicted toxin-antitoxin system